MICLSLSVITLKLAEVFCESLRVSVGWSFVEFADVRPAFIKGFFSENIADLFSCLTHIFVIPRQLVNRKKIKECLALPLGELAKAEAVRFRQLQVGQCQLAAPVEELVKAHFGLGKVLRN